MDKQKELAKLLLLVKSELRTLGLWQTQTPSAEALASTEPFAVDRMSFVQWLQFVFLPRMYQLIETGSPLPENCSIAPMAEESFKADDRIDPVSGAALVAHLRGIDELLSQC